VHVERDGDLAVVVLDNPPLNLFDELVFDELERVSRDLAELTAPGREGRARAVLVEARGKLVSGGVDVGLFEELVDGPDPVARATGLWARLLRTTQAVEDLPVPTVFAAHGLTLTAAFELALACDLLVAAEGAAFGLVEMVVGLTPSLGGPQRLAERAGPARAKELVFTGDRYPAAELERWGVVNRVLPDEGFAEAARAYAHRLAAGPTLAHAATKRLVTTAVRDGVRAADAVTPAVSGPLFGTADLRGAVDSFLRRGPGKATYTGR
jgi:enoyl-CoA hydratase/carnithine racemase